MGKPRKPKGASSPDQTSLIEDLPSKSDRDKIRRLEVDLVEAKGQAESLRDDLAELQKRYDDLDRENTRLEAENDRLSDEIAELRERADYDAEDIAVAMHKEVEADYFHARDFDYKQRLKEMGQAAIDRMRVEPS